MKMTQNFMVILCLLLFVPSESSAMETSTGIQYATAKLGYFMPNGDSDGLDGYDSTFNIGATYGRFFADNIAVEIGFEYHSVEGEDSIPVPLSYQNINYDGFADYEGDISITVIPITGKYYHPVNDEVTAFFGAGIGWYQMSYDWDKTYRIPDVASSPQGSISDDGDNFGFHLVGGAEYAIQSNISVGAELKWSKISNELTLGTETQQKKIDKELGGITFNVVGKILF